MSDGPVALAVRPPFDGDALLAWLAARAVPGVEQVVGARYRRVLPAGSGILDVDLGPDRAVLHAGPSRLAVDLLDLDLDPADVLTVLGSDPVLEPLVRARPGLRRPGTVDPDELAIRAVIGQQVSVAAARTIAGRLAAEHGEPVTGAAGLTRAFPTMAVLAALDPEDLPMPRSRGRTLVGVAAALASGRVVLSPADPAGSRSALLALPGIGPWTADYVAMRALRDPDAFPAGDLVIRQAATALGLPDEVRALTARAEAWRPLRAYAAHHLWAAA